MRTVLLIASALVGVALAVQVLYARSCAASATRTTRVVWAVNAALLALLAGGFVYLALTLGGR